MILHRIDCDDFILCFHLQKTAVSVPYRDLMSSFEQILSDKLKKEGSTNASFPVTLGINAFRGFLDEFMKKHHGDKKKKEERKIEGRAHKRDKQKKDTFVSTSYSLAYPILVMALNFVTGFAKALVHD